MNRYYIEVEGFYIEAESEEQALGYAEDVVNFFPPAKAVVASIILWDEDIGVKL